MRTSSLSSPAIVLARALLLVLAAAAVAAGFVMTRKSAPKPVASGVVYMCPMMLLPTPNSKANPTAQ